MGCIHSNEKVNQPENIYELNQLSIQNTKPFSLVGTASYVRVVNVYDGDTITIIFRFGSHFYHKRCRIYGIDTPEIRTKNNEEKQKGIEGILKKVDFRKNSLGMVLY